MPYIITTRQPNGLHVTERAVATLDEAREQARHIVLGVNAPGTGLRTGKLHPDARQVEWSLLSHAIATLPEPGGTIGPLPDGTVIEVRFVEFLPHNEAVRRHNDAFNAR